MTTEFSEGYSCWIFSENDKSSICRKLEWYLHFQPLRSQTHKSTELSHELEKICENVAYVPPKFQFSAGLPLTIACSELLPAQVCVVLPEKMGADEWFASVKKIWTDYGKPKTRLFLPEKISKQDALVSLGAHKSHFDLVEFQA